MPARRPLPFAVGRLSRRGSRLVILQPARPFPGPWDVKAVFAS
jgi:hypothetical protein